MASIGKQFMENGRKQMEAADILRNDKGAQIAQKLLFTNRGFSTDDVMGFGGLCTYAFGKLLDWFGI